MTSQLEFRAQALAETQNQKLYRYFLDRPGRWIPMPELAELASAYAIHSRMADLRRDFGMDIRNKKRRVPGSRIQLSFYQYVPPGADPRP